jgi:hypothetical protein
MILTDRRFAKSYLGRHFIMGKRVDPIIVRASKEWRDSRRFPHFDFGIDGIESNDPS